MILPNFKDFPRDRRLLGIDWGLHRVGIAISDERQAFVFTRSQIECKNESLVENILDIINKEKVSGIIIGLPIRSNGTESDTTKMVREFAAKLSNKTDLPIGLVEENLTSFEAEENLKGKKNIKQKLDSEAAKIILSNAIGLMRRSV